MPTTHTTTSTAAGRRPMLPAHPLGWTALVLLLLVIAVPAWWGALQNVVETGLAMTAIAVVLGVSAFTTAGVAIRTHRDDAVVLRIALVVAAAVTLTGLTALVGFAFEGP